ncbi:hypothetical protein BDW74DRAFT_182581 [Aspergillus multicolor]|uniref:uncharacterized protein n=1 Tax=Aspergillus multicolor TaxID=41759 RepID=UPI003CCCA1D3
MGDISELPWELSESRNAGLPPSHDSEDGEIQAPCNGATQNEERPSQPSKTQGSQMPVEVDVPLGEDNRPSDHDQEQDTEKDPAPNKAQEEGTDLEPTMLPGFIMPNGLIGNNGSLDSDARYFENQYIEDGVFITIIEAWRDSHCLKGLQVTFSNGASKMYGRQYADYSAKYMQAGEVCRRLVLWGNGNGTRTGKLRIETNIESWEWGKNTSGQTAYPRNIGSGILIGFRGYYNTSTNGNILSLAPLFLRPIDYVESRVRYPGLPQGTEDMAPQQVDSGTAENPWSAKYPLTWTMGKTVTRGVSQSWSQSTAFQFGMELKVTAGVPGIVETETGMNWSVSTTTSHERSETFETSMTWEASGTIDPGKGVVVTATTTKGTLDRLKYNSEVRIWFTGDSYLNYVESGYYRGITYTGIRTHHKHYDLPRPAVEGDRDE